jgi:hypothetical protein
MADEKANEKEQEKRDEKSAEEKSWDEKWRRDPLSAIVWAAIFIWAGVVFLANNLGFLGPLRQGALANLEAWSLVFLGAGAIVLLEVLVRLLMPEYRRAVGGSIFFALFLIGIGLGNIFGWDIIWPLILIALGLSIVFRGILRR